MRTALITGSASGIGRATAERLREAGWRVYATDVDADGLDDLAATGCLTHRLDVTDPDEVASVVDLVASEAGRIDCLVNNAGYGQMGPVEDVPVERMRAQFDVNYWGPVRLVQEVLPHMRERGAGTIVNVASVMGRVATPGWGSYVGSKHALEGTSDALRVEVDDQGIDVVLIEPAWVDTGFADRVAEHLAGVDRSACYADVYASLGSNRVVEGGPLSVTPERVAAKIHAAAEADDPKARYAVGLSGRLVLLSGLLPDAVYDYLQKLLVARHSGSDR